MKISQNTFEIWFVISCIAYLCAFFIGSIAGFTDNFVIATLVITLNMLVYIYFDVRKVE